MIFFHFMLAFLAFLIAHIITQEIIKSLTTGIIAFVAYAIVYALGFETLYCILALIPFAILLVIGFAKRK